MDKRDLFIVLAGGVLLVAATVLAGVRGDATADYRLVYSALTYPSAQVPLALGPLPSAGAVSTQSAGVDGNVTLARFYVNMTSTTPGGFPTGASARLEVVAPNGTTIAKDATAPAGATDLRLVLEIPSALMPQSTTVRAPTEADARAMLAPKAGGGQWNATIRLASGAAPAAYSATFASAFDGWVGIVAPAVPIAR